MGVKTLLMITVLLISYSIVKNEHSNYQLMI